MKYLFFWNNDYYIIYVNFHLRRNDIQYSKINH
jgi:hypothetical protein